MATPSIMINLPVTGGTGVTSLNSETGAINLVAGSNITITPVGQNITIASTGGGTPGGIDGQVQFNDASAFGGAVGIFYDKVDNFTGIAVDSSFPLTLSHNFQVGGGNTYLPPSIVTGTINYHTPPAIPATATAVATYVQKIDMPPVNSATQVDFAGIYIADNTVALTYFVAAYVTVDGVKLYSSASPNNVFFTDNNDGNIFYVIVGWTAVPGATGYEVWVAGSYNGNVYSFVSQDVGNVSAFADFGAGWTSAVPYPPSPLVLAYPATNNTSDYEIYDFVVADGVNLFSTTSKNISFTDDNRNPHPPASGSSSINTAGGTYISSNYTHQYEVWAQYADGGYAATSFNTSVNDGGPYTVADVTGLSATQQSGFGSYSASGWSMIYYVVSYRSTPSGYVFSTGTSVGFTDDSSFGAYSVQLLWTPAPNASGYLVFIDGSQFSFTKYSQMASGSGFLDSGSTWAVSFPYPMNSLTNPSWSSLTQNNAVLGFGPSDGSYSFTYTVSSVFSTPLGTFYSPGVAAGFTDLNDGSPTFGIDLAWTTVTMGSFNATYYQLWVQGTSSGPQYPARVTQLTFSNTFTDTFSGWGGSPTLPVPNTSSHPFTYEVQVSWASVSAATNYLVLKAGGDMGWSYNFYYSTASTSFNDTDDSIWTAYGGSNPPLPVEMPWSYDIHLSWATVTGSPTYRIIRQYNGGGFTGFTDTASTSLIDGNYSFSWAGSPDVTNTLYHATGATQAVKFYSFNNAAATYSASHTDLSVTDNNSGNYYSVTWAANAYPSQVDKFKLIINTIHGELISNPTLSYLDINQSYNSNTTVTPSLTATKFFSDTVGNVTVDTLTCLTTIITPKIGNTTGLMQLGANASANGIDCIAIGNSAVSDAGGGAFALALGPHSTAYSNAVSIGQNSLAHATGVALGNTAVTTGDNALALGLLSSAAFQSAAVGVSAAATGSDAFAGGELSRAAGQRSLSLGYSSYAAGPSALAAGEGCEARADQATAIGYFAIVSNGATASMAIGPDAHVSGVRSFVFGKGSTNSGADATVFGNICMGSGNFSFTGGYGAVNNSDRSVCLGYSATINGSGDSVSIGTSVAVNTAASLGLGASLSIGSNSTNVINIGYFSHINNTSSSSDFSTSVGLSNNIESSTGAVIVGNTNAITSTNSAMIFGQGITNATANSVQMGPNNTHKITIDLTEYYMLRIHGGTLEKILGDQDTVTYADEVVIFNDSVVYY